MAGHLSKKGDRHFKLEGTVIRRSSNGTDGGRRTKHVSSNTLFPRGSNPHAVSPTVLEAVRHVSLSQKDIICVNPAASWASTRSLNTDKGLRLWVV